MTDPTAPLFSIILPTRDRPDFLHEAIESVNVQTVANWELIVVDDASDPAVVIPIDERIRLVRLDTHSGPATARNAGLSVARGRYIAFLDDDDLFTQDRLEVVSSALSRTPVVVCWSRFIDQPANRHRSLNGDVGDVILDDSTPSLGAVAVDRGRCLTFDERWRHLEDVDWWLRVAEKLPVTTVSSVGYLIRRRATADKEQLRRRAAESGPFLEAHREYFRSHRRALAFRLKRAGLIWLAAGNRANARRTFARSFRVRPGVTIAWHLTRACWPRRRRS